MMAQAPAVSAAGGRRRPSGFVAGADQAHGRSERMASAQPQADGVGLRELVFCVDADQRLRSAGDGLADWFGAASEHAAGRTLQDLLGEAVYTALQPNVDAVLAGARVTCRVLLPKPSGATRSADVTFFPDRDAFGVVRGFFALLRDVSEPVSGHGTLDANEARLQLVLRHLPVGVWLTDASGTILLDNPAGEQIWGRRFRGRDHQGAAEGRDLESGRALTGAAWSLPRALSSGEPVLDELFEVTSADGETRTIVGSVIPLKSAEGAVYGAVVVNDDVTTLRGLERRLREREERLTLAQRAAGIGTFEWFIDDDRVIWTPELEALYGLAPGGFEGRYESWARRVHPADLPLAEASLWDAARGGKPFHAEFRAIAPDGAERWLLAAGDLYRDANGEPWRIVGVNIDITERKRLEQEREHAVTQLREQIDVHVALNAELRATAADRDRALHNAQDALQVRDEFLSSVSHDFRTPLTTIKGVAQLLSRRAAREASIDSSAVQRQLEAIEAAVVRMTGLVDDLLDLSRLEGGRGLELTVAETDLVALARRVAREHQRASPRHTIEVDTGAYELRGAWDGARLERVLSNLISNAVKFSPEGGPVAIAMRESSDTAGTRWAEVSVRDEGLGIPPADLSRVFERFQRGSNVAGRIRGTGVGLATVKQIVELHGGSVAVTSSEGRGTILTVRLPIRVTVTESS